MAWVDPLTPGVRQQERWANPPDPAPSEKPFRIAGMAKLALVYGMRLLPADEITEIGEAPVELKNGRKARVTMHLLEGSREEIEKQLRSSIAAFFDFYPEI